MYILYSHVGGAHPKARVTTDVDREDVAAWVCPPDHVDRPIFDAAGDCVYDSLESAFAACVVEDVEIATASGVWTRKDGQNRNGGLNAKGRAAYNKANGAHLKAPSKDAKSKRRKSFCARMKGMKHRLTSRKTAADPDSRINKALRAWRC